MKDEKFEKLSAAKIDEIRQELIGNPSMERLQHLQLHMELIGRAVILPEYEAHHHHSDTNQHHDDVEKIYDMDRLASISATAPAKETKSPRKK